jgi:hypothetical protein
MMIRTLATAALLAFALPALIPAFADEQPVEIKAGPERELVETTCGACHSLDYIRMNAPFQTTASWSATVNKMINVMHAPVEPDDAKKILDYLVKNYGS